MRTTSALLTRREVAEIGQVPLYAIDKAIEQGVVKLQRRKGKPLLTPFEVGLLVLLRQIDIALSLKVKGRLREWLSNRQQAVGSEFMLSEALRVTITEDVEQTIGRAESYARLRDLYVERNPAVMGGEPVVTGTRVPLRTVAALVEMGETPETLSEDYPQVPREAHAVAVLWARANPRRGRPMRPWEPGKSKSPPRRRPVRAG